MYYNDKRKYEGLWKGCKREGKSNIACNIGKYYKENGKLYECERNNDKMNGKGYFILWLLGICYYPNGNKYEGEFKDEMPHGIGNSLNYLGKYYAADGSKYEGEWENGKVQGKGTKFI